MRMNLAFKLFPSACSQNEPWMGYYRLSLSCSVDYTVDALFFLSEMWRQMVFHFVFHRSKAVNICLSVSVSSVHSSENIVRNREKYLLFNASFIHLLAGLSQGHVHVDCIQMSCFIWKCNLHCDFLFILECCQEVRSENELLLLLELKALQLLK